MRQLSLGILVLCAFAIDSRGDETAAARPSLRITVTAYDKPDSGGTTDVRLETTDGVWATLTPVTLPFATVKKVVVEGPKEGRGHKDVRIEFQGTGPATPDNRYLIELWVSNAEGRVLWHTWQVEGDARLNKPIQMGSRIGMPSLVNHPSFRLPASVAPRMRTIKVQLRKMTPAELRHFPSSPSEIDLAMARPDKDGRFVLSFAAPEDHAPASAIESAKQRVAVSLANDPSVKDAGRSVRFAEPQADGRYRVAFQLDPKLIDKSEVGIAFYEAQPGDKDFGQKFFVEGKGANYSGSWYSTRVRLLEVPLVD